MPMLRLQLVLAPEPGPSSELADQQLHPEPKPKPAPQLGLGPEPAPQLQLVPMLEQARRDQLTVQQRHHQRRQLEQPEPLPKLELQLAPERPARA